MERQKTGFFSSQSGIALNEGLIVFPIMVLAVAVCIEFTFVMYQWNSAAKAMQLGVRKLIVSDPVTTDFDTVFAFDPAQTGELIPPNAAVQSICGAGAAPCDANQLNRLVNGGGAGSVWPGLRAYYPSLQQSDIRVTYEQSGLGYQGRPNGPVVTVRLELVSDPIDFLFLGGILNIFSNVSNLTGITFPPFTVTATSEDMCNSPGGC